MSQLKHQLWYPVRRSLAANGLEDAEAVRLADCVIKTLEYERPESLEVPLCR